MVNGNSEVIAADLQNPYRMEPPASLRCGQISTNIYNISSIEWNFSNIENLWIQISIKWWGPGPPFPRGNSNGDFQSIFFRHQTHRGCEWHSGLRPLTSSPWHPVLGRAAHGGLAVPTSCAAHHRCATHLGSPLAVWGAPKLLAAARVTPAGVKMLRLKKTPFKCMGRNNDKTTNSELLDSKRIGLQGPGTF